MKKTGCTQRYIKYICGAMAVVLGLIRPYAALAVEQGQETVQGTEEADQTVQESESISQNEIDGTVQLQYITGFEALAEEDAYFPCMYKPALEELLAIFPETIWIWTQGAEAPVEVGVTWECNEDFGATRLDTYVFYPKWDETQYAIADGAADSVTVPSVTVTVPKGIISDLQGAKNALQEILKGKSVLALVYLCDEYEVKKSPSYESDTVRTVPTGQSVQIVDVEMDMYGSVWYQVRFYREGTEYAGYVEKKYLATSDEDFIGWEGIYLDSQPAAPMTRRRMAAASVRYPDVEQFPSSYQNALLALKEKHPEWIFVRMNTGIDWNTAVASEMGDKSLVHSSVSGSWQNGASKEQGWSYASEGILKYYMDPRNFLNESSIFQFEQLTYNKDYHTTTAVQEILKNSFMSSLIPGDSRTYAQAFVEIGQNQNISPFHLASRVLQEQGTQGTSPLISGTYRGYEGYYNYFNVKAAGGSNAVVIENGLKYAKSAGWNTRYQSLTGGARVLSGYYIPAGQDTLYLQKFNVSNGKYANFTHQYMQNIMAPSSEASNIKKAYQNVGVLESGFVFKIPVYNNMPSAACSQPEKTDVITLNKSSISSLAVDKKETLIPYVNGSKVDYVSDMTFASSNPSVASVDSQGRVTALTPGTATISCTRAKANTATCTVTVVKGTPNILTPDYRTCTYREGLKLADISLPDGWAWESADVMIATGTSSYTAVYTPEDTTKYNTVTRQINVTVSKAIPTQVVPEGIETKPGTTLGAIALPDGFVWESDINIVLQDAGTYTFYASYNPDVNNYDTVSHIGITVQVLEEAKGPFQGEASGGNGGSTTGGGNSGGTSGNGSGSGTGGNGNSTSDNGSGSTDGNSGTSNDGKGDNETGGEETGGNGNATTSADSTAGSGNGNGNHDVSTGNITNSQQPGNGAPLSTLPDNVVPAVSTGSTTVNNSNHVQQGSSQQNNVQQSNVQTGNVQTNNVQQSNVQSDNAGQGNAQQNNTPQNNGQTGDTQSDNARQDNAQQNSAQQNSAQQNNGQTGNTPQNNGQTGNTPQNNGQTGNTPQDNGQTGNTPQNNGQTGDTPSDSVRQGNTQQGGTQTNTTQTGNSQADDAAAGAPQGNSAVNGNRTDSNRADTGARAEDNAALGHTASEENYSRPSVTIRMEDTTILTSEKLQTAKEQNFDLLLDMGDYVSWTIHADAIGGSALTDIDMGVALQTANVPTGFIAEILDGNQYLEFTTSYDGTGGFEPVLNIALNPENGGRYANLFCYVPELEKLEFVTAAVVGVDGTVSLLIDHAASYILIVSDSVMSGTETVDAAENGAGGPWKVLAGVLGGLCLPIAGYGALSYKKKSRDGNGEDADEEEYDADEDGAEDEEYDADAAGSADDEEYFDEEDDLEAFEDAPATAAEVQDSETEESEWIEDDEWKEMEVPKQEHHEEEQHEDRTAHCDADDWIEDDEWDTANDWVDDEEWEKMNRRR